MKDFKPILIKKLMKQTTFKEKCMKLMKWTNRLDHFKTKLVGWCMKTLQCRMKWEMPKKISDCLQINNKKWFGRLTNINKGSSKIILKTKILNKRWINSNLKMLGLTNKFKRPNKISDFLLIPKPNLNVSWINLRPKCKLTTDNLKPIVRKFRNLWLKIHL